MGIDPGARNTGLGLIKTNPPRMHETRLICTKGMGEREAIDYLYTRMKMAIESWEPHIIVYEKSCKNHSNVMVNTLISLLASQYEIPCYGYAPQTVKKALTGDYRADKPTVEANVRRRLEMNDGKISNHEADALATALCYVVKEK